MKKFLLSFVILALAFAIPGVVNAVCSYPSLITFGNSYCIQVCTDSLVTIQIGGIYDGPDAFPQFILESGCSGGSVTHCNQTCAPIDVPTGFSYVFNPIPSPGHWEFQGSNNCLVIVYYWVHDNIWAIEIYAMCNGCFCLTFDRQLSAELTSLTAVASTEAITLRWNTASETESQLWLINRATSESGPFDQIGSINAAGTTAIGATYTWTDNGVIAGQMYFYRLSLQDVNSNITVFDRIARAELLSNDGSVPSNYALYQNHPNPFNPSTQIEFDMKEAGPVTLKVYNMIGQEVATLVEGNTSQGHHVVTFDASHLPSALYVYKMEANGFSAQSKMLLMR